MSVVRCVSYLRSFGSFTLGSPRRLCDSVRPSGRRARTLARTNGEALPVTLMGDSEVPDRTVDRMAIGARRSGRRSSRARRKTTPNPSPSLVLRSLAMGLLASGMIFAVLVAIWKDPGRTGFGSPDEALTQQAIRLMVDEGAPYLYPPFEDPEAVFVPRLWASVGDKAVPTHPPMTYLLYAALGDVTPFGQWVIFVIPSVGFGALLAGVSILLKGRWWLAPLLPGLIFPVTFRFLKPWENMALFVACASVAFLAFVLWRYTGRWLFLWMSWFIGTFAAIVRPDQSYVVLGLLALTTLAFSGLSIKWHHALLVLVPAGISLLAFTLLGNLLVTGDAFSMPVFLLDLDQREPVFGQSLGFPVGFLVGLLAPNGIPAFDVVVAQVEKYAWKLGPARMTVLAFGAIVVWEAYRFLRAVVAGTRHNRVRLGVTRYVATILGVALLGWYAVSRITLDVWGASAADPSIGHSIVRYWAVPIAATGIFALMWVGRQNSGLLRNLGIIYLGVASWFGVLYVYRGEARTSLADAVEIIDAYQEYASAMDADLPPKAIIYSRYTDKFLWDVRPLAVLPTESNVEKEDLDVGSLVDSLDRALSSGYTPVVLELAPAEAARLRRAAAPRGIAIVERTYGERPQLRKLLIRWESWEAIRE